MKLQILVPQYHEDEKILKQLMDSIALQQNVDMNDIGVVICNDGSDIILSDEFISSYPFMIEYCMCEHRGVSATRNACLDNATADYVMFCDADDMFYNACGLYILFREMNGEGFDALVSVFTEETRGVDENDVLYINHDIDCTFVHGKVYRRQYLIDNNIRWNDALTIHEDSYFNCLAQRMTDNVKYCPTPFYLWKWRDDSVCRHDPKYILKTYNNMIDSNTSLVKEFIRRERPDDAKFYISQMIYDSYFTMNKDEWINQEHREYRDNTERRFSEYYREFKDMFNAIDISDRAQIIMGIKNRMFQEGLLMESITFDDWIRHIEETYK